MSSNALPLGNTTGQVCSPADSAKCGVCASGCCCGCAPISARPTGKISQDNQQSYSKMVFRAIDAINAGESLSSANVHHSRVGNEHSAWVAARCKIGVSMINRGSMQQRDGVYHQRTPTKQDIIKKQVNHAKQRMENVN